VVIIGLPIGVVSFLLRRRPPAPWNTRRVRRATLDFTTIDGRKGRRDRPLPGGHRGPRGLHLDRGVGYPDPHTAALGVDGPYGSGDTGSAPLHLRPGNRHVIVVTVLATRLPGRSAFAFTRPLERHGHEPFHSVPTTFPWRWTRSGNTATRSPSRRKGGGRIRTRSRSTLSGISRCGSISSTRRTGPSREPTCRSRRRTLRWCPRVWPRRSAPTFAGHGSFWSLRRDTIW